MMEAFTQRQARGSVRKSGLQNYAPRKCRATLHDRGELENDFSYHPQKLVEGEDLLESDASSSNGAHKTSESDDKHLHHNGVVGSIVEDNVSISESSDKKKAVKFKIVRVFSGLVAGAIGAFVTFSGGYIYALFISVMSLQFSVEYGKLISSQGLQQIGGSVIPVPQILIKLLPVLNCCMVTLEWLGWTTLDCSFTVSSFIMLIALLLQKEMAPTFEHASFGVFGVFYCGFLPTFWLKLRSLAALAPVGALHHIWPVRSFASRT